MTLLLFGLVIPGESKATEATQPLKISASILPLADFVRQVGKEHVQVQMLIPPGTSPHLLELKPSALRALSSSRLLVLNGLGLEFWAKKVVRAVNNLHLKVISCGEGLNESSGHTAAPDPHMMGEHRGEMIESEKEEKKHGKPETHDDHSHEGADPHVWLDPLKAMKMVTCIEKALSRLDPAHKKAYQHNAKAYREKLKELHKKFEQTLHTLPSRTFVSFHEGYGHLAQRYNLKELAIVPGMSDFQPTPERLARVIREIQTRKIKVIFAEPQFSASAASTIAHETGAKIALLDPLGTSKTSTYLSLMEKNRLALKQALTIKP